MIATYQNCTFKTGTARLMVQANWWSSPLPLDAEADDLLWGHNLESQSVLILQARGRNGGTVTLETKPYTSRNRKRLEVLVASFNA